AVPGSVLIEFSLPFLLLWRTTRPFALLLGLIFHGLIALGGAPDYTAVILCLYVVFFDDADLQQFASILSRHKLVKVCASFVLLLPILPRLYKWIAIASTPVKLASGLINALYLFGLMMLICYVFISTVIWIYKRQSLQENIQGDKLLWNFKSLAFILAFNVIYLFSCLGPYTGFKFFYSQAMFSNLNIHGTNHYVMPRLPIFQNDQRYVQIQSIEFQSDRVTQLSPQIDRLTEFSEAGPKDWVHQNYIASIFSHACREKLLFPIQVKYKTRDGVVVEVDNICNAPIHLKHYPLNLYPHVQPR
ncbi:MAG: HTTM domain-containing protein, partial [Candidatus Tectomicrobia bacterium]|nr:HTTM domain-containing protein [Candidatus Tectomicrobia bacterium]